MRFISTLDCIRLGFPYIHASLTLNEPAPKYEEDASGMGELEKVLSFIRSEEYYPTFEDKAAYLIASIAGSQYFQNGNKRLATVTLLLFLIENDVRIKNINFSQFKQVLLVFFPEAQIEDNSSIQEAHPLFLYNLAIVLGDRSKWGTGDFTELRKKIAGLFKLIYKLPEA